MIQTRLWLSGMIMIMTMSTRIGTGVIKMRSKSWEMRMMSRVLGLWFGEGHGRIHV